MILVGAVLLAIYVVEPPLGVVLVALAALVEIGETFFWIWLSKRWRIKAGPETILGERARVVAECRPLGQVRVQGELWQARCDAGAAVGETVRVRARENLTLLVERE